MKYFKSLSTFLLLLIFIFAGCSRNNQSKTKNVDNQNDYAYDEPEEITWKSTDQKMLLGSSAKEFACRVKDDNTIMIPVEEYAKAYGIKYEVCGRCGHVKLFTEDGVMQVEWNSPYIIYADRTEQITLKTKNVYDSGLTWASVEFLNYLK